MILPFALTLALTGALRAGSCDEDARLRLDAAREMLDALPGVEAIDRSGEAERAVILLERTVEDAPSCGEALTMLEEARAAADGAEVESIAANLEAAILEAEARIDALEASEAAPAEVESVRFLLSELSERAPDDARIGALQTRAAALGGAR